MSQLGLGLDAERIGDIERTLLLEGIRWVVGTDEVGRGPLAGPVTAAAVRMDLQALDWCGPLDDSKKLTAARRAAAVPMIHTHGAAWSISHADPAEVDRLNVLWASMAAMRRAVLAVVEGVKEPFVVLVDGNRQIPDLGLTQRALVKGDSRSYAIAAASILAKESRDAMMVAYDSTYPGYGFAQHKGYPTAAHLEALSALGATEIHRRSFAPVRAVLEESERGTQQIELTSD